MPVIDISELPENMQEVEAAPIRPGTPPLGGPPSKNDIPNYFSGTIAPQLQHDGTFVGMKYQTPGIPSHPIMPVAPSGQAAVNAAITSVIKETIISAGVDPQTAEFNWRGVWQSNISYAVYDVVQQNISTYLALTANTNVKPDSNPGTWVLISKNLNFRGQYGSQGPNYPTLQFFNVNTTFSLSTSFAWSVTPTLSSWSPVHNYTLGVKIVDSNGNQQTVTTSGISQPTSHPTWATTVGAITIDGSVVWTCGGTALAITIGDVLFLGTTLSPLAGSATATITDSSGNVWTQIGTTETYTNGDNSRSFTLQLWTTVATKNVASGGSYTVTVNATASSDGDLTIGGFNSSVGILKASTSATTGSAGPLAPGPIILDQSSFMIFASSTTRTSGFTGGNPPWNFLSTGSGAREKDVAWGVLNAGIVNPTTSSAGGVGGLCCTQSQFVNQGSNLNYVPFDVVIFNGSTYVCVVETASSPRVSPSSWVLLSQGAGSVNVLSGNYLAVALDDGKLITNSTTSTFTLTLPNLPVNPWWWIAVQNSGTGTTIISPNGANIDGSSSNITLVQNQGMLIFTDGTSYYSERGFGTVFSVALTMPGIFIVNGSPITGSGTLAVTLANEAANTGFMGPSSGGASTPNFRTLVPNDIPVGNVNSQTANYTAVSGDSGKIVSMNGSSNLTLTLPSSPPSANWFIDVENVGAGVLTIARNGLNIDGAAANLTLVQNQGVRINTDGTNYFTQRGMSLTGGVNSQSGTTYTAVASDSGKLLTFSSNSAVTLTLPATPPSQNWWIAVEAVGTTGVTISRNGLTIDGAATNLSLTQNQGVMIFTDGSNYFTERGIGTSSSQSGIGGVNSQTASYTALTGDSGKLISMNSASALTLTLPAVPPSSTWMIAVENVGSGSLTVSRNGLNIDGAASNLSVTQNQGVLIFTDGSNYFTSRGMASGGGGGGSIGGVLVKTANYTAQSTDNGQLVIFNVTSGTNQASFQQIATSTGTSNTMTVKKGDFMIAIGRAFGANPVTITDTMGNVWVSVPTFPITVGSSLEFMMYCQSSVAAGSVTITAAQSGGSGFHWLTAEYSGVGLVQGVVNIPLVDKENKGTGTSTTPNSGTITTAIPSDLIIGWCANESADGLSVTGGTSGWNSRGNQGGNVFLYDQIVSATQSGLAFNPTLNNSVTWGAGIGAFQAITNSAVVYTLLATPPSATWMVFVTNESAQATITINPNGDTLNGSTNSFSLGPGASCRIFTDGTNYFLN